MDARTIIAAKRDRRALNEAELRWFADGLASGQVSDSQAGAFAMAVLLNGMTADERLGLTLAMRDTGKVQDWDFPGPKLDKHSTGGIGDNVSLMLAPALAACGAYVPMVSGRGLGHTGGTLDKLDAIPGYRSEIDPDEMRRIVAETGCAIVGAGGNIAPADKRLYAVRDVTGTVESRDLITASILSKKLAIRLDGLVLDVKTGSGAFLSDPGQAEDLAEALVSVANGAGCPSMALITDMNESLASAAGNALEVANAVAFLKGDAVDSRLWDVTVALGGALLELGGLCEGAADGQARIADAFQGGAAAERFGRMVAALGGPVDFIDRSDHYLPKSPVVAEVAAPEGGFVQAIDLKALGLAVVGLGGGRQRQGDKLDLAVGLRDLAGRGAHLDKGDPIAVIHAASKDGLQAASQAVQAAYRMGPDAPGDLPLILQRIG